ncbi:RNA-dependent RNA polymerase [Melia azedarach]|uniref:RNA-dependent RNA polymerase n=1 Tax=Melia azedarach TaxID=155640 RepID=A0ACC1X2S8_MELAZ|nr:RNA-dependent RNA polymerase [Melia azedarach]
MAKMIKLFGFTSMESPQVVKEFLEGHTGEGTVSDVQVGQEQGARAHAIVEFATNEAAELIKSKAAASRRLWFGNSYLKASVMNSDGAEPKRRIHKFENLKLNFGCQISKENFSVLWSHGDVSVRLCSDLRKFEFFLSYASADYKLELSYENIWQIKLRHPCGQSVKYLIIQLFGAPQIYERDLHWVREVDFTPSSCIGQASAICLELPRKAHVPKALNDFFNYEEIHGKFTLQIGSPFSCNSSLVPVINPPEGIELPFKILFKINSLVQHGYLPGPALDAKFFRLVDPSKMKMAHIEHALENLFHLRECCYEPVSWLREQYRKYFTSDQYSSSPAVGLDDDGLVYINKVLVTPSKVYFCGPEISLSNRVVRSYPEEIDSFLRVSFVDEDKDKLYSTVLTARISSTDEERRTGVYERILSTLRNGIVIGDKKFETLGFSNSQLKENSLWMFASRPGLTAADIRDKMGDFREIKNVAKYAARLGQSFGSSRKALHVDSSEMEVIPDIETEKDGITYNFSDGIGKISAELAEIVAGRCGYTNYTPSAFQIRYCGYKGVVAVDPTSSTKLSLRKSMCKYKSDSTSLDILGHSKYQQCFLNRQLITLLSTLGVNDDVFERKQRDGVAQLDAILTDRAKAYEALELMSLGENTHVLKELLMCGYKPDSEPFLSMMLQTFRASNLLELRTRTRIFVQNGRAMMGCLDETGTLEYGQVFIQYSSNNQSGQLNILRQNVVVAKNPCLHPGDMRVLSAVDVPALHHMKDCVVFPAKGERPHTNECSGSDLDGDIYFVCWDLDLIPPLQFPPMDYSPAPERVLDRDVTVEDVQEYFVDYIVNDSLGIICNAHVAFADSEPDKGMGTKCLELSKLSSIAVDFSKTGVAANIPGRLRVKEYPDFMEKQDKKSYDSQRVIGKLYREVKDIAPTTATIKSFTKEVALQSYDPDMEVEGFREYISDAFKYKTQYDNRLGNLMDYYGIKSEAEIISGCIMEMAKSFDKKRDLEDITFAIRSLRKEARAWFNKKKTNSDSNPDDAYAKASAWYYVTYHQSYWGRYKEEGMNRDHFLSFPWCIHDKLMEIKRGKQSI